MRKLGVVALVTAGLLILAQAIPLLSAGGWAISSLSLPEERPLAIVSLAWSVGLALASGLFGAVLIARRERLASRWFDDGSVSGFSDEQGLLRVGLVIIGVVMVAWAVPDLISAVARMSFDALQKRINDFDTVATPSVLYDQIASLVASTVQLAVGLILVAKSASFSGRLLGSTSERATGSSSNCASCGAPYDPDDYTDLATARCVECHQLLSADE